MVFSSYITYYILVLEEEEKKEQFCLEIAMLALEIYLALSSYKLNDKNIIKTSHNIN